MFQKDMAMPAPRPAPDEDLFAPLRLAISEIRRCRPIGRIEGLSPEGFTVTGLGREARLGDDVVLKGADGSRMRGEVHRIGAGRVTVAPMGSARGLGAGQEVELTGAPQLRPCEGWLGRIVDPFGRPMDGRPLPAGLPRSIHAPPPDPALRRPMGARIDTGVDVLDALLPLARGQRIGLFAGSGVGKTTLLGELTRVRTGGLDGRHGGDAEVRVLALIGERGREVMSFVRDVLGAEGMENCVVVAATSDMPAGLRRRAAWSAMTVAEHFRDAGRDVMLLLDSVTRFAEAHREVALAGGEEARMRGHPPSLVPTLAALCERAGPGTGAQGDLTAVFSVLTAGSDMEEPVADTMRGLLDGHVVLDRRIAEGGRYPAVDVLASVSRCLPEAASPAENEVIAGCRKIMELWRRSELMVTSGLYERGGDPALDRAVQLMPRIEAFLAGRSSQGASETIRRLAGILGMPPPAAAATAAR
jgi:flagellum-specific ATP synthase